MKINRTKIKKITINHFIEKVTREARVEVEVEAKRNPKNIECFHKILVL